MLQDESNFLRAKEEFEALSPEERTDEKKEAYQDMKQAFEEKRTLWRQVQEMTPPGEGEIRADVGESFSQVFEPGRGG